MAQGAGGSLVTFEVKEGGHKLHISESRPVLQSQWTSTLITSKEVKYTGMTVLGAWLGNAGCTLISEHF